MKLFGTDGVRGTANVFPMTPDIVMRLAIAASQHFRQGDHRHVVVIGKDTRLSGYMLEPALTAGFISMGMSVMLVGPMPTPALSMLVPSLRADLGVMISASHNPYQDNGIKLFGPDGYKLSDEDEHKIEEMVREGRLGNLPAPHELGRAQRLEDAPGRYIEFVKNTFPKNLRLDGLRIVVDCAHGAAYKVAPTVFWELGAEIIPIGINPNGFNINRDVGATSPKAMCEAVVDYGAHLGIALDGDADRVVMADENGRLIDGDQLIGLVGAALHKAGNLQGGAVVGTVMANLALEKFLESQGLNLIRTAVGDRHVSEAMRTHRCNVGGEQSGHIILSDYTRTGDGLIAALQVLSVIVASGKPASEVAHVFDPVPQILKNLKISAPNILQNSKVVAAIENAEKTLGDKGRLLVRNSGTEPLLRLMAQGYDADQIEKVVNNIIEICQQEKLVAEE
jgi:phosphoglucosamine mutase